MPGSLADLLEGLAGAAPGAAGVLAEARAIVDHAAAGAAAVGGWTADEPLRLSKGPVSWLLRCPRRALTPDGGGGRTEDLVLGLLVDGAAKLATLGARRPVTVDASLAFLAAQGDTLAADHLDDIGEEASARVRAEAATRIERLARAWPALDAAWWPRVEEPVRVRLADGGVMLTGKLDVLLGGPPTGRPAVVVEVKSGRWHDAMRADAHLYGLLVGLRDGAVPAAVVTVAGEGTTQVEPLRPAVVLHAAERVEAALRTAGHLAAGEVAERRPGPHCGHCPARPTCEPGQAEHESYRQRSAAEAGLPDDAGDDAEPSRRTPVAVAVAVP